MFNNIKRMSGVALVAGFLFVSGIAWGHHGAAVYSSKCASCHAKDGKGNPSMLKSMGEGLDLSKAIGNCVAIVKAGKGKMPQYEGKLSDEEINDVCAYVKTLK